MTRASHGTGHQQYFAFIRAINVGGRRLTNEELKEPFVELGLTDVAAYQAAGNITFRSDTPDAALTERLQAAISESYGFDTPVFVRSRPELVAVEKTRPFTDAQLAASEMRIQVSFMHAQPTPSAVLGAQALVPAGEGSVFANREWFWLPIRGVSESQLPVGAIERLIGPMTMRTLGTITRMLRKFA